MRIKWFSTIRVLGMLFVLFYHFYILFFPGGFIGVDLFFTLSGYLTTALFLDEYAKHQAIDFKGFFKRRFYRIFPPVVLTLLLTTPLALLVRNDFIAGIGRQLMATLGFMTNFFEILSGNSYENQFTPHLFLHTWSLALEVHFYLLWALIIWGITRLAKTLGQLRGMVFLASSGLFLISFLAMFISSFFVSNFSTIYFATWTHIFPFFLGSTLASLTGLKKLTRPFERVIEKWDVKQTLAVFAAGLTVELLLLFFLPFDSIWTYLVGFLLSSSATAVMIYAARILHEKTENITEPAILLFFSNISYGIYLFHWPFYTIFSQVLSHTLAVFLTLIFSILFASLSFYLLEPYLAGKNGRLWNVEFDLKPYTKWIGATATAFLLVTLGISLFAPRLGNFERESLISNLYQAERQLTTTRSAAENAQATDYNVEKGTTIIGDSVSLRANTGIQNILPEAHLDGAISRNLSEASHLIQLYTTSHSLKENVVIALGTNTSDNYQELLDELVSRFPKGHRLIFVTPYDGNNASEQALTYQIGQYERNLASKYDYISIADWYQTAIENPQIWINTDLVHFNLETEGATLFAQTIQAALEQVEKQPVKNVGSSE
ncbi:acyltransferase family protein [Streptococcus cuniculi]|uniref:Acyltransferase n=1 Tax=Streptococcus cuniculi TaxID=1432788 RepID=A0A4Y9JEZ5_9STRE|nr:acyltransferase family protein [Streptococcus cuniculi]MBF0777199.1 acyltransferase [Streptococcus cuniculi]TFU98808.1 acyltransferase [Streptococcus cuniculi]